MTDPGSISQYIADVKNEGSSAALERICQRYYERLAAIAGRKLQGGGRVADRHAIANEAIYDFFSRSQAGDFENVSNRGELLPLLIRLTKDRVTDEIRRLTAQKRGGGKTRGNSIFAPTTRADAGHGFDAFADTLDSPSTRQIVREEAARILDRLPDQTMRTIVILRLEGYKNEEIARELDVSLATVERKRRRIRDLLRDLDESA